MKKGLDIDKIQTLQLSNCIKLERKKMNSMSVFPLADHQTEATIIINNPRSQANTIC